MRAIRLSDDQRTALWNDARQLYRQAVQQRWVVVDAAEGRIPPIMIIMLVGWLIIVFAGLGYLAPRNAIVTATFLVAALLRVINAPSLQQARAAKEILMNELGVIYRKPGPAGGADSAPARRPG